MLSSSLFRGIQLSNPAISSLKQVRCLTLTFSRMDEAMDHLKSNPYFDKYAEKLNKAAQKHPSELVSAVQKRKTTINSEATNPLAAAAGVKKISAKAPKPKATMPGGAYGHAPPKTLDSVMKTDLLTDKSADNVAYLWTEHWKTKPVISGVIKADYYKALRDTAVKYDKFLFPLPREQGYEFIFAQFSGQEIHFTPLINFQAYGENAPECLTMVHFTDLSDTLGIVLMKGEFDGKVISNKEAAFLANQVQLYFSGQDAKKSELVRKFHENPKTFSHMDLVNELEQLDLGAITAGSQKS